MKAILSIIFFLTVNITLAQPSLKVGDAAPGFDPYKWINTNPVDIKRGRIHVIEFGATWCTPCAKAIPELSRLAKNNPDITVISTFVMEQQTSGEGSEPAYVTGVKKYVTKKADLIQYTTAIDWPDKRIEKQWITAAGLNGIPAIFVIDTSGRIAYIGSSVPQAAEIVAQLKAGTFKMPLAGASPPVFNPNKLLLVEGNGGDENNFLFRSLLTAYDGKIVAPNQPYIRSYRQLAEDSAKRDRVQLVGVSMAELYYVAYGDTLMNTVMSRNIDDVYADTVGKPHLRSVYGKQWHLPVLQVSDASPFQVNRKSTRNRFSYSLKVPAGAGASTYLKECMQADLHKYFGYNVTVEKRAMPVWNLIVVDARVAAEKLQEPAGSTQVKIEADDQMLKFRHAEMRDIIWMLGSNYSYSPYDYGKVPFSEQAAFIDCTGIKTPIQFYHQHKWTFNDMKLYLKSIGLDIVRSTRVMNVIVISD